MSVAATMCAVCRERLEEDALMFWQFVLRCLAILGDGGMSDEEDGDENGERIKLIRALMWRNPYFRELFALLDSAPDMERQLWSQSGRHRLRRVVTDRPPLHSRPIPKDLPRSFFSPAFLDSLHFEHQIEELQLRDIDMPLYQYDVTSVDIN